MEAYDWYDFVLDGFGKGYYMEEASEVELGDSMSAQSRCGADEAGKLTDEASNAREMVCCARVMIAATATSCGK